MAKANPAKSNMVKIKIPKTKEEKEPVFVGINEETWLIQRGVEVEVPDYVALFLQMREDQIEKNLDALPD